MNYGMVCCCILQELLIRSDLAAMKTSQYKCCPR